MFGDPFMVWHDGPDFTALLAAARSNARSVPRMLAAGISAGDPLPAEAVTVLATFTPTPKLIRALKQGVCDDEYLVRYHSANALLRYAGLTGTPISTLSSSQRFERRRPAAHRMLTVLPGETPRTNCPPPLCANGP
jgi:hypothetical protein